MLEVLLTNDDGVHAAGINAVREALLSLATVSVYAPDRDRSGASNSLTLQSPIRVNEIAPNVVSIQGTPTDCVHLAITGLMDNKPDLVLSGINAGSNLGDDVWYSGTVAAAMEGRFMGVPAIAVSMVNNNPENFDTGVKVILKLFDLVQRETLPANVILNVNVPDVPFEQLAGYEVTRLGARHCAEPTIRDADPRGRAIYWVGPPGKQADAGEGTDFHAIKKNKVSITPLNVDITDYSMCDQLKSWLPGSL